MKKNILLFVCACVVFAACSGKDNTKIVSCQNIDSNNEVVELHVNYVNQPKQIVEDIQYVHKLNL